jgi:hypothetical protein
MSRSTNKHNAYCNVCFSTHYACASDLKNCTEGETLLGTPIVVCRKHGEKKKKPYKSSPDQKQLDFGQ